MRKRAELGTPSERFGLREQLLISCMWLAYNVQWGALLFVVLPRQIAAIVGPEQKEVFNGLVMAMGAAVSLFVTPIAGALSDGCRSPLGRRRPFLIAGALVNVLFLALMATFGPGSSIWLFALCFLGVEAGCNAWGGPYAGLIPDVVPKHMVGRASGVQALMTAAGLLIGVLAAGQIIDRYHGYWPIYAMVVVLLLTTLTITVAFVREKPNQAPRETRVPTEGSLITRFLDFFPNPRLHANFYWVLATRAMQGMGVYSISPYFQYFLLDLVKVGAGLGPERQADFAAKMGSYVIGIITVVGVPTSVIAGSLSDKHGRKPLVYLCGAVMATAALVFIGAGLVQSLAFVFCVAALFGMGNGAYQAVDWALALDVLPSGEAAAKDMGVWHVSLVIPQIIATGMAGAMIKALKHQSLVLAYTSVFVIAAVWFILSTVFVRKIRGVR